MSRTGERVPLAQARDVAEALAAEMRPWCERIEVAGSIRRGRVEVGDVEMVAVPRWEVRPVDAGMLTIDELVNLLHAWALEAAAAGRVRWTSPHAGRVQTVEPKPAGKVWFGVLPGGLKLDLFLVVADNFGLALCIRTGPAAWSQALVTRAAAMGLPCREFHLTQGERPIATPEERDVFRLLRLKWREPRDRTDHDAQRVMAPAMKGGRGG